MSEQELLRTALVLPGIPAAQATALAAVLMEGSV